MPYRDINDKEAYNQIYYLIHSKQQKKKMKEYYIQNKTKILKRMKQTYENKKKRK